jgi:hypothetical protein
MKTVAKSSVREIGWNPALTLRSRLTGCMVSCRAATNSVFSIAAPIAAGTPWPVTSAMHSSTPSSVGTKSM